MDVLVQDVRYAFRVLAKNPSFAAIVVITVALGIAANTTILSWISTTILDPVPGASHTNELVTVMRGERSEHPTPPFSYPDYVDLREKSASFSGLLAYHDEFYSLTDSSKPERVYGAHISANYFEVLGVKPFLGSNFLPVEEEKPGRTPSVVISYGLWQRRFGSDPTVIGKPIRINRNLCTIVGVAPPGFEGCKTGLRTDLWAPLVYRGAQVNERAYLWLNVLGRLKPGIERRQAEAELDLQMRRIAEQYPESHRGPNQITLDPLWRSPFGINVYFYKTLPVLLALAAALLLLACANVANLLLVHFVARRRELAIRLSLGSSRTRLMRQLILECLLLALAGGGLAALLSFWTAGALISFIPFTSLPLTLDKRADQLILLAAIFISLITSLICGILPAWRSSKASPVEVLKEEAGSVSAGFHKSRLARTFVVVQISLSLLLLVCAGLFVRSLQKAEQQDPGFDPNNVLLASFDPSLAGYTRDQVFAFGRQLIAEIEALPGVESATIADFSPLSFTIHSDIYQVDGYEPQQQESMEISRALVGPNYFKTIRTDLVAGRDISLQDTMASQRVAVVNEAFVARFWPGSEPIGKRIKVWDRWFTIIGVAGNAKYRRVVYAPEPCVFLPLFQTFLANECIIHARVTGDPQSYRSSIEKTVHGLNPELPLFNVITLKSSMQLGSIFERVAGTFAGTFGLLSLLLAAVGIYAVVSYATRQRTREIGIRLALGAQPGDVFRMVLIQGFNLAISGITIGLLFSVMLTRFLRGMLFGVSETDIPTIAVVAILLCLVTLAACFRPALRAAKANPNIALRYE
ncbi:MAG: ABC transporter permease [Acidobacteria bacterium]|nr:ABC transporter permease [Acidobacteriota bacterium]